MFDGPFSFLLLGSIFFFKSDRNLTSPDPLISSTKPWTKQVQTTLQTTHEHVFAREETEKAAVTRDQLQLQTRTMQKQM
jgi:hypothetical protein